jgi:anti-anti-sigma regulatory factor
VLRIQRSANGKVVFTLCGRIEEDDLAELRRLLSGEKADQHTVLDLKNVTIVDRNAVQFLARCEARSIQLENCPAYIREWIRSDRAREM